MNPVDALKADLSYPILVIAFSGDSECIAAEDIKNRVMNMLCDITKEVVPPNPEGMHPPAFRLTEDIAKRIFSTPCSCGNPICMNVEMSKIGTEILLKNVGQYIVWGVLPKIMVQPHITKNLCKVAALMSSGMTYADATSKVRAEAPEMAPFFTPDNTNDFYEK